MAHARDTWKDVCSPSPERAGYFGTGFPALVRRTVLLNVGIALPILGPAVASGGRVGVVLVFVLLPSVSVLLWSTTFAIAAIVALCRVFARKGAAAVRPATRPTSRGAIVDEWLDGPLPGTQ